MIKARLSGAKESGSKMDEKNLRRILSKLDIQVINKSRTWLEFACPFAPWLHRKGVDRNPSCGAVIDNGAVSHYKCHTCKMHGRISSLVRSLEHYRGVKYPRLALEADLCDVDTDFGEFEGNFNDIEDVLGEPLNEAAYGDLYGNAWEVKLARDYLVEERDLSQETVEYLGLGYDPKDGRVTFPVRHLDGSLYGYSGRTIFEPDFYPYDPYPKVRDYLGLPKKHLLLGAHDIDRDLPVLVVEGLFDYAWIFEIGGDEICNPVALLGSEMTPSKADILKDIDLPTYLLVDNDDAGDDCLYGTWDAKAGKHKNGGAIDQLKDHVPLMVPTYPEGINEPDGLTIEELEEIIDGTEFYSE